jgi:hypothetical protein
MIPVACWERIPCFLYKILALGLVLCGTLFQFGARGVVVGDKNWPACSTGAH